MTQPLVHGTDPDLAMLLGTLEAGKTEERSETILWRVVDLFERDARRLTESQIELFDVVLGRLTDRIEASARIALSERLAGNHQAPPGLMERFSMDERIEIAGPVLSLSERLGEGILIDRARTSSQLHLLALSRRAKVPAVLSDILVERGELPVLRSIAGNVGASFSDLGFRTIIARAGDDDDLSLSIGSRADLPSHHFLKLLTLASEAARIRLEASSPHSPSEIRVAVDKVTQLIGAKSAGPIPDHQQTLRRALALRRDGLLGEIQVGDMAEGGDRELLVASLAVIAGVPLALVDSVFAHERAEGVLVLTRAIGFSWITVRTILVAKARPHIVSSLTLERAAVSFERLRPATALQALNLQAARYRR